MKKGAIYLILTFITYLIGNLIWFLTIISKEPLLTNYYLDNLMLVIIFTIFGILGLISGINLYKRSEY